MKKKTIAMSVLSAVLVMGCAGSGSMWTTVIDGASGLENFDRFREANWTAKDGAIQADRGGKEPAYLVSKQSYTNFEMHVEFWASDNANSGVFLRCQNRQNVGDETCYEANIFDQRPDPSYATGAIVKVAPVPKDFERAGGKWNSFDITAQGNHLTLVMNGKKTVDVVSPRTTMLSGPFGLQWGQGTIKFRKVQIREL
jgi:hypothetical protein